MQSNNTQDANEADKAYIAYANASVQAVINANSVEQAKKQFCDPHDTFSFPVAEHTLANVEIDRGIDFEQVDADNIQGPCDEDTQRVDPHSRDPDIKDLEDLVESHVDEDDYSMSGLDGVVNIQLHHDNQTTAIVAALAESDYSFSISQVFECPPHLKVRKQIDYNDV